MILLFLGSWRSTLIVCISIPLSILTSLAVLYALGETINIMTLGGLALAVGILVDDATVEIENIHRNLGLGKGVVQAILDGAQQIAVPAFVSTLCICIVFVPVVFLTGAAQVSVHAAGDGRGAGDGGVLPAFAHADSDHDPLPDSRRTAAVSRAGGRSRGDRRGHHLARPSRVSSAVRENARRLLRDPDVHAGASQAGAGLFRRRHGVLRGCCIRSSARISSRRWTRARSGCTSAAPAARGSRKPNRSFAQVEESIRRSFPREDLADILDNIGLPNSGYNLAFSDSVTLGPFDGEILVSLKPGEHRSTWDYVREMRRRLPREFPDLTFFFQPADIVGQILNFGLPAPIDVQVVGPLRNLEKNHEIARGDFEAHLPTIPGAADVHVHQVNDVPMMRFDVDRARASQLGFTQKDVANGTADFAQLQRSGDPELLGESGQRRRLSGRGADADVSYGFAGIADEHADSFRRRTSTQLLEQRGADGARHHRLRW